MPDPITASVGEPTPVPKRPTLYLKLFPSSSSVGWDTTSLFSRPISVSPLDLDRTVLVTIPGEGTTGEVDRVVEAVRKLKAAWLPEHIVKDPLTQAVVDVIVALAAFDEARKGGKP